MTTRVEKHGRNLHIWPEGITEPFIIKPLPGNVGLQITDSYINSLAGDSQGLLDALMIAIDGARQNALTERWEPLPEEDRVNYNRIGLELSLEEAETVMMPAFFWQTVLGFSGVKTWLEAGEGLTGTLKAVGALHARSGNFLHRTSSKASATD